MARPTAALTVASGDGQGLVARFSGVLDFASAPGLEPEIVALVSQQASSVTIDLTQLDFADSTGMAVLLRLVSRFGPLPVHGASDIVRRIITGLGLQHVLLLASRSEDPPPKHVGHFDARPASVWAAREFVLHHWPETDPQVRDVAILMVSELASNAIRHAATAFDVSVSFPVAGQVRIGVSDHGTGSPHLCTPSSRDLHGRGLQIVELLSESWGIEPSADGVGKTVWFCVRDGAPAGE